MRHDFRLRFSNLLARLRAPLRAVAVALPVLLTLVASTGNAAAASRTHVYLFAGLFGAFFSTGMTTIADKLHAQGIEATVYDHSEWQSVVNDATNDYRSGRARTIILVGYSAGVLSVNEAVAHLSGVGVPVRLAIGLDPMKSTTVSGRVGRYVNFYNRSAGAKPVAKGGGFHGTIQNVDLSSLVAGVPHDMVDDNPAVQAKILGAIRAAL